MIYGLGVRGYGLVVRRYRFSLSCLYYFCYFRHLLEIIVVLNLD